MPIRILPDDLASQIAAGEVVERPASVVKELVENALDAGASAISVRIKGAGVDLIEVVDDGSGIPADELPLALARHATSKLASAGDLAAIHSLGFRGEALAAIASVSQLTIVSRVAEAAEGAELRVDGGNVGLPAAVGAPPGTAIEVRELFFNVPARRKFLKSDATERRHVTNLLIRYALAYPEVRFSLEVDGRMRLQTVGNGDRREILGLLYGTDLARRMIEVDADYDDLKVSGFISPTDITRPNRAQLNFFINGRWVQDIALSSAVVQAYRGLLMVGRYPQVTLFVDLPPEVVDVNVHPTKAEVRFLEPGKVFSGVQRAVRRAMLAHAPVPDLETGLTWRPLRPDKQSAQTQAQNVLYQSSGPTPDQHHTADASKAEQGSLPRTETGLLRLVGQVGSAYLVAEAPDGLYLVDQHAAHERVLYERFRTQQTEMESQALLEPLTVELSEQQAELLEENMDLLSALGYEIEPFGPNTFKLRALPALLISADPEAALRVVVEDFEEDETPLETQRDAKLIARVCKRAAVKAGQKLSVEEQEALLRDLEACESPRTCPHGRPTMIHLSIDSLERQFGRRGAR